MRLALGQKTVKSTFRRRYDASGRQASARRTRRRVLAAAHHLFVKRGYAQTTMVAIAKRAGVSIETVYESVGGKAQLVRYLVETALSGTDEPVPPEQRRGIAEIHAEPSARRKLVLFAGVVRPMLQRLAPIWQVVAEAAPHDADLRAMLLQLRGRHVSSMRMVIEHIATAGQLRSNISIDTARDVLWAMNSPEFYWLLAVGRDWSGEQLEEWLADAWQRLLLEDE